MKHLMILLGILVLFGCAVDENQFDDNFANDQFQWMETDGVTEDHITDGAEMDQVTVPSDQKRKPPPRRVAPSQPQQGSSSQDGIGGGMIGDSIPMDPDH